MTNSICLLLGTDHQRCDELFTASENAVHDHHWDIAGANFQAFLRAARRHFDVEESILFPAFEQQTGILSGPTQIMRREHAQMRELFDDLESGLGAQDRDRFLGTSETVLVLLQQHNLKEEQILYPMADRALAAGVPQLLQRMREHGVA